jgi:hypothetical protein
MRVNQQIFPWLGINDAHHDLSHKGDGDRVAQDKLVQNNRWYAEQIANFLGMLKAVPEGGGTMLDNTLVVWGNSLSVGNIHSRRDLKYVLAGGGTGFRMGRFLRYDRAEHNDLLLAICHGFGRPEIQAVGPAQYSDGPLPRLM